MKIKAESLPFGSVKLTVDSETFLKVEKARKLVDVFDAQTAQAVLDLAGSYGGGQMVTTKRGKLVTEITYHPAPPDYTD